MEQHIQEVYNQNGKLVPARPGLMVRQGWTARRGKNFEDVKFSGFLIPVYDYIDDITSRKKIVGFEIEPKKF